MANLPNSLNLLQTSIGEISLFLQKGQLTSVDLVKAYLSNIDKNNRQGLQLRAIIQTAPGENVLRIAHSLDEERRNGRTRGPLHGIPILVKDCIATDTELGLRTSAGNTALQQSIVNEEAEVIKRLRSAGAIILAKTNLTELCGAKYNGRPFGWSAVGGQSQSAYVKGGDPIGSSAGSAVGVSAGMGAASLGTETAGSVNVPASRAALFGIRPSTELVSGLGNFANNPKRDTIGPIGFTAEDVAIVLDAMTDNDGKYLHAAQNPELKSIRLGLIRRNFLDEADGRYILPGGNADESSAALHIAISKLTKAGAERAGIDEMLACEDLMRLGDFKEDLNKYLLGLKESPVRYLEELIKWNQDHAEVELPLNAPSQHFLLDSLNAVERTSDDYRSANARSAELAGIKGLDYIFDKYKLDAAVVAMDLGVAQCFGSAMGYASGTAPLGQYQDGAPFGILFLVRPREEQKLISILSAYEKIMPKRPMSTLL